MKELLHDIKKTNGETLEFYHIRYLYLILSLISISMYSIMNRLSQINTIVNRHCAIL